MVIGCGGDRDYPSDRRSHLRLIGNEPGLQAEHSPSMRNSSAQEWIVGGRTWTSDLLEAVSICVAEYCVLTERIDSILKVLRIPRCLIGRKRVEMENRTGRGVEGANEKMVGLCGLLDGVENEVNLYLTVLDR